MRFGTTIGVAILLLALLGAAIIQFVLLAD